MSKTVDALYFSSLASNNSTPEILVCVEIILNRRRQYCKQLPRCNLAPGVEMKKHVLAALSLAGFVIALGAVFLAVALITTRATTLPSAALPVKITASLPPAGVELTLLTWNLGYGGLGAGADFVADGGKGVLPKSPEVVAQNLSGFRKILDDNTADVLFIQEIATSSPLNYGANVLEAIEAAIPRRAEAYSVDVATALLPPPLKVEHGKAILSRLAIEDAQRIALPLEESFILGAIRHNYSAALVRIPISNSSRSWVLLNVHFAAFDTDGEVRRKQLQAVLEIAQREYQGGNPVVIGGDFNMEFLRDPFPSTEDVKLRFWIRDFPRQMLPEGWHLAYGTNAPSVRTLAAPYVAGANYTTVVDGFILSPEVVAESIHVIDTQFEYSDHQPSVVTLRLEE